MADFELMRANSILFLEFDRGLHFFVLRDAQNRNRLFRFTKLQKFEPTPKSRKTPRFAKFSEF